MSTLSFPRAHVAISNCFAATNAVGFRCRVSLWIRLSASQFGVCIFCVVFGGIGICYCPISTICDHVQIYIRGCSFGVGDTAFRMVMVVIDNVALKR